MEAVLSDDPSTTRVKVTGGGGGRGEKLNYKKIIIFVVNSIVFLGVVAEMNADGADVVRRS